MTRALLFSEAPPRFPSWELSEPATNRRGGKSVYVWDGAARTAPLLQLVREGDAPLRLLSTWREGARSLDVELAEGPLADFLRALDDYTRHVAAEKCGDWFGKSLAAEDVARMHAPLFHEGRHGSHTLRLRLHGAPEVWRRARVGDVYGHGSASELREGAPCWLAAAVSGLYFLPRSFGLTLTVTDVMLLPEPRGFPFATALPLRLGPEEPDVGPASDDEVAAASRGGAASW